MNENLMNDEQYTQEEQIIDIQALLLELWGKAWIVLIFGVIAAFLGFAYSVFLVTPMYRASTSIYVLQNTENLTTSEFTIGTQLANDYVGIIRSRSVCEAVANNLGLDVPPAAIASAISVSQMDNTRIVTISAVSSDPLMAQRLANEVRESAKEFLKSIMNLPDVNTVDEAVFPTAPYTPNTKRNTLVGFITGFILAAGVIAIRFILDDTVKTEDDVKRRLGLSVLGMVPVSENLSGDGKKKNKPNKYANSILYSIKRRMKRHR